MPAATESPTGLFAHELTWTDAEGYTVHDGEILQQIVLDHIERHDDDFAIAWYDDALTFSFPDDTGPRNRYRIDPNGSIYSGYGTTDEIVSSSRHATVTEHRLNALVGRANKTQELVDHIQQMDDFGVAETVFRRYCEEPMLSPADMERTILQHHGGDKLRSIRSQQPHLITRAGQANIPDHRYDEMLDAVAGGEPYTGALPEATKLDYQIATKGRDMTDWYDFTDPDARKAARNTHRTVMQIAGECLDMEDVYEDVMQENRLVYGEWPDL